MLYKLMGNLAIIHINGFDFMHATLSASVVQISSEIGIRLPVLAYLLVGPKLGFAVMFQGGRFGSY